MQCARPFAGPPQLPLVMKDKNSRARRTNHSAREAASARELGERSLQADTVLIGPGMVDADESAILLLETLPEIDRAKVILCSAALTCLAKEEACLRSLGGRILLVACADELAGALWL